MLTACPSWQVYAITGRTRISPMSRPATGSSRSLLTVGAAIVVKARRPDVGRLRSDQPAVAQLLQAVRRPADHAADGERRGEEGGGEFQTVQQECRVELDIGVEATLRLALPQQPQRGGFDLLRQMIETLVATARIEALRGLGQHIRARVPHPVDAMPESHEALAPIELGADDRFRALGRADFKDHVECRSRCA